MATKTSKLTPEQQEEVRLRKKMLKEKRVAKVKQKQIDTMLATPIPSREKEDRYREIVDAFKRGKTEYDIIAEKSVEWGIKTGTVRNLIHSTLKWVGRDNVMSSEYYRENAVNMQKIRLEEIYQRAMNEGKYKEAIAALQEENKIMGLYGNVNFVTTARVSKDSTMIQFEFGTCPTANQDQPIVIDDGEVMENE